MITLNRSSLKRLGIVTITETMLAGGFLPIVGNASEPEKINESPLLGVEAPPIAEQTPVVGERLIIDLNDLLMQRASVPGVGKTGHYY